MERKRFSLNTVADLRPGDHLCWIYETEAEHRAILTPFMRQGLERNEKVLYIADTRTTETILDYLREDGLNLAPYLERRQLEVVTYEEIYLRDGVFDPDVMIALLRAETEKTLAEGYTALRVTGEMTWISSTLVASGQSPASIRRLVEYEAKLNRFFSHSRCLAICQYDRQRFAPEFLLHVVRAHPIVVVGQEFYENVYYVSPDELLKADSATMELEWLVRNLARHKEEQAKLWAERDFSDAVMNTAGALVVVLDREGRIVRFNRKCEQVTGYTEEEVLGRRVWDFLLLPEEADAVRMVFEELRAGQFPNTFENVWVTKEGSQRLVAWSNTALLDSGGAVAYVIGTGLDITERREAEVRIKRLNTVLRSIRDINQLIARERERTRLIKAVAAELVETGGYYHAWCLLVDEQGGLDIMAEARPGSPSSVVSLEGVSKAQLPVCMRQALAEHSLVVAASLDPTCDGCPQAAGHLGDIDLISVCLMLGERVYGALTVCLPTAFSTDAEEQALLREVAGDIAFALHSIEQETHRRRAEQALRENEHFLKAVLDSIQDGISVLDRDLNIVHVNRVMNVWYRQNLPLEGKKCYAAYHNHNAPCDPCPTLRAIRTGKTERDVVPGLPGSPTEWLELFSYPMTDPETGEVTAVVEFVRDITGRTRAEKALRERESLLNAIIEAATDAIFVKDMDLRYRQVNQAMADLLGMERASLLGKSDTDLFRAETVAETARIDRRVLQGETMEEFSAKEIQGELRHFHTIKVPLYDAQGEVYGLCGITRDITEQVRAAEERERLLAEVQKQAERLQQVMDGVPVGVVLLNSARRVVMANRVAREDLRVLAGVETGEILTQLGGQPIVELLTSSPSNGWHEVNASGQIFEVIAQQTSSTQGWVLVINEVTKQRELETRVQQQARLSAVGQLAAGIAHDFNNIMSVIVLYTQMGLRQPDVPPGLRERLEVVAGQANRATELIQQILDFSRRVVLERRPMDLRLFLEEVIRLLERMLPESIEVDLVYEQGDYTVNADPTRMQQVIMNLAINARDAMPEGGQLHVGLGRLHVEKKALAPLPEMQPGDWVVVTVADTGTGIPPEALPHIFEPFFTTKEVGQGSGLGLAQVYGIVRQHEGYIDVNTRVGEGTTFTIYLPALLPSSQLDATEADMGALVEGAGETLLVVEDNEVLRTALADGLRQAGYQIFEAGNGQEALEVLAQHPEIALVLSDLVMPAMGGKALADALRKRGLSVPIVLLSGHPMGDQITQIPGVAGWMLKPPDLAELTRLLARLLRGSGA